MSLEDKIDIVKDILRGKKVAVGFSGGADSTLITYLSSMVAEDTLAITIDNHLLPTGFIENAQSACETFGVKHEIIDIDFYEDEDFLSNGPQRCFTCRDLMYSKIEEAARENGFDFICDGNNISDLVADRPGILITYKKDFKTPFITAKLTSKEIHEYLDKHDIGYSRSTTCLATRIPTNTPTTSEKIRRISYCEDYISDNTNCEIVKVRDLGELGIIEVDNVNEILTAPIGDSGFNPDYGLLGSNKATEEKLKLFPKTGDALVNEVQKRLVELTGKQIEVMVYGDGAFKDPVGKIWELADPVVSPAHTSGLVGYPNEIKLKYVSDNKFADLKGDELKEAIKEEIRQKDVDLTGQMITEGTTPRVLTDLIGSLCDLTSGSGDKGTPVVFIQGYFDNLAND